jgi:hypothetical protein
MESIPDIEECISDAQAALDELKGGSGNPRREQELIHEIESLQLALQMDTKVMIVRSLIHVFEFSDEIVPTGWLSTGTSVIKCDMEHARKFKLPAVIDRKVLSQIAMDTNRSKQDRIAAMRHHINPV